MTTVSTQPDSIGIEDEDEFIAERDFFGLPPGFVAVARVQIGVDPPGYKITVVVRVNIG